MAFTLGAGLLTMTPGLDTALVLRTAAVEGRRRALLAGLGICLGCLLWGILASAGLGALASLSRPGFTALRLLGALYLLYLGVRMLVAPGSFEPNGEPGREKGGWFLRGLLTNLLNPKVGIFYMTFLPQFVPRGVRVAPFSMLLATIHAFEGILWFLLLASATDLLSAWLKKPGIREAVDRVTGTLLVLFGFALLRESRS